MDPGTHDRGPGTKGPHMLRSLAAPVLLALSCASSAGPAQEAARFDGTRAFEHLRKIVEIGPRPAGSEGAAKTREYITAQLETHGLTVQEQAFDADMPIGPTRTVNLRATIHGRNGAG